jgi:hypothetical protein
LKSKVYQKICGVTYTTHDDIKDQLYPGLEDDVKLFLPIHKMIKKADPWSDIDTREPLPHETTLTCLKAVCMPSLRVIYDRPSHFFASQPRKGPQNTVRTLEKVKSPDN